MYSEVKRVEYLDSIRGLAALFVLLSHSAFAFAWPPAYNTVQTWPFVSILFNGKEAVGMFFVLSGYVLSKPYLASAANPLPRKIFLPTFYLRRFTRIWLPWFFVFLLSILARRFWFGHPVTRPPETDWLKGFWQASMTPGDFFRQCVFQLHEPSRQLLNQDWSLGVELKGSLLIPVFLLLATGRRWYALAALAIAFPLLVKTGHYYSSFIVGVLTARFGELLVTGLLSGGRWLKVGLLLLGLTLYQALGWAWAYDLNNRVLYQWGWVASSVGCGLILLATFSSRSLQHGLSRRPAVFLGRISYSMYLIQFIVILCCLPPLLHGANQWGIIDPALLFALSLSACVIITLAGAAITYRLVEVPVINLGHQLTKKLQVWWPH